MDAIKKSILNAAYQHYVNTGSMISYCVFPQSTSERMQYFESIDWLENEGYLKNSNKAIGSAYITLTDYALSNLPIF